MSFKNRLKIANQSLREGDLDGAIRIYEEIIACNPALKGICETNINIAKRIQAKKSLSGVFFDNNTAEIQCVNEIVGNHDFSVKKIAVIFHVYHEGVVDEVINSINKIEQKIDLFVTTSLSRDSNSIRKIFEYYPDAEYIYLVNKGRDILPFLNAYSKVIDYDLCLKIHTKQGLTNYGDLWRDISLKSLLKDEKSIHKIIKNFENDRDLVIAGPKDFYCSGRRMIHGNHANLIKICSELNLIYDESRDWAFFAGTMFWFRPLVFKSYYKKLRNLKFEREIGRQDGGIEHAIERVFGLIPSYQGKKAMLLNDSPSLHNFEIVNLPERAGFDDPTKVLENISKKNLEKLKISGDVNKQSSGALSDMKVRGWLAKLDDAAPRSYIVRIGNQEIEGVANVYRSDLEDAGIHKGCHAFEVSVPLKFSDGVEHNVSLFDKYTGFPVASHKYKWPTIQRSYSDFQEYLSWSYCGQYVQAPFVEEDKRAFSVMNLIADDLSKIGIKRSSIKFSIIMPTYNRSILIKSSILSVLNQVYTEWELIVVDDGSQDDTEKVVLSFNDKRIRYIKNKNNIGVSSARNVGLEKARGDYIAYLDSDNEWDNRYLSAMAGAICDKVINASAIYCGQIVFSGSSKEISGVRFGLFNKSLLYNNNYIDLNCFIHKRAIGDIVIRFDESLPRFVDWDLIVRLSWVTNIVAIPVLLSNYYLEISDNSLTSNGSLTNFIEDVRRKIKLHFDIESYDKYRKMKPINGISIVIPSYEAFEDIQKCLASIEVYIVNNLYFELIVVDNNSSEKVVEHLDKFSKNFNNVKIVKLNKNYGFTYAVNRGIELANKGNDILLLNNDAFMRPDSLYVLQQFLYSNEKYALAVPAQILPGGTETICTHVPYALPEYDVDVNISVHHKNLKNPPLYYDGGGLEIDFAPFFCVLIKNLVLQKAPYLDVANGRHYRSDRTYCSYVRNVLNMSIIYCPDSIVYHGLQKSTKQLKRLGKDYNVIFEENTWTKDELNDLGFHFQEWNAKF